MAVGRQFGREASIYLAGFVGAGLFQFVAIPVYSRALGPTQFGVYTLTVALTAAVAGIMSLGGDVALARLWPTTKSEAERRSLASTWILFLTLWSTLIAVIGCAVAPWVADQFRPGDRFAPALIVGLLGLVPTVASSMLAQVLRNNFRPVPFAVTTALVAAMNSVFGIWLGVGLDLGVYGVFLGLLIGQTLGGLARLPLVWRWLGRRFVWPLLIPLLRLGTPFVPASLAMWVFTGADRLVLGAQVVDAAALGSYGLAAMLVGPFTVLVLALGQAWVPRVSDLFVTDPSAAREATVAGFSVALSSLGIAALSMGTVAPWLVGTLGGSGYEDGAKALPFLALGSAFAGSAMFASAGLALAMRTGAIALVAMSAAALNIVLLLILVPRWGLVGAAVSVATSYAALAGGAMAAAARALRLTLDTPRLVAVCALLGGQATLSTLLPGSLLSWVSLAFTASALSFNIIHTVKHLAMSPAIADDS